MFLTSYRTKYSMFSKPFSRYGASKSSSKLMFQKQVMVHFTKGTATCFFIRTDQGAESNISYTFGRYVICRINSVVKIFSSKKGKSKA